MTEPATGLTVAQQRMLRLVAETEAESADEAPAESDEGD